jgi:hypothetical protein
MEAEKVAGRYDLDVIAVHVTWESAWALSDRGNLADLRSTGRGARTARNRPVPRGNRFPYLQSHEEPAAIRKTELLKPERGGGSGFWGPHTTVFAIDNLLGQRRWLDEDLEHYRQYYQGGPYGKELPRHYKMAKKNWDATSSSMT